jgi:phospholipase/carboxylesterase
MSKPNLPRNAGPVEWIGPDHSLYAVSGLVHCVRLSKEADLQNPAPVVVMLHGWGGDECSMWLFKQVISPETAIITPRAPVDLGNGGYLWFHYAGSRTRPDLDSLQKSRTILGHFLTSLPDLYPIDPERMVLIGFSQGAAIGNSLVLIRPKGVVGVASLSGFMPELPDLPPQTDLSGLPVFIAHGTRDDIVPPAEGRRVRRTYTQLGADVTYGEYSVGHKINSQGMKDLKAWMVSVVRSAS